MVSVAFRFSHRTSWNRTPTDLATVSRANLLDLTVSNPTAVGLDLASVLSLEALSSPSALRYDPDPHGVPSARQAISRYYEKHGAVVSPGQITLTASTSESYTHLFRLLCDPGDEVLVAQPSYPLFDYLADLADVRLRPYPLFYDHGWHLDTEALERAITPRTRALIVVHPNNPTGHSTPEHERTYLRALCSRHSLALIVDEVFLDYAVPPGAHILTFAAEPPTTPTFVLSGLSKIAALPQMKVGWIVALALQEDSGEILGRLEIIADTFLSVNMPAQLALPLWLEQARSVQELILSRVHENLALLHGSSLEMIPVDAGWSAVLRLPRTYQAYDAASALLEIGVLVHPASFYGMPETNRVIISLLTLPATLHAALERIRGPL